VDTRNGLTLPEKRKAGREILTPREPAHEDLLKNLPSDLDINAMRRTVKTLWAWRNEFNIRQHRRGVFSSGRIRKADAEHVLKRALAMVDEGGAQ
jgi:hypothetical protein